MINDVIEMLPLALKHRVDGDTLIKIMNGLENKSSRDSILNIRDRRVSATKEREEVQFDGGARRLKDMGRQEIIATEKALNPSDV
jgi:magnesium chelatase subunit I